jgi:tetratricopeptide (TPR) repeat protein
MSKKSNLSPAAPSVPTVSIFKKMESVWKGLNLNQKIQIIAGTFVFVALLWWIAKPWIAEYYYREAYQNSVRQDFKGTIHSFETAVNFQPIETQYQVELGKAYQDQASRENDPAQIKFYLDKALQAYNNIIKINPENPWYQNRLADVYLMHANFYNTFVEIPQDKNNKNKKIYLPKNSIKDPAQQIYVKQANERVASFNAASEKKVFFAETLDPNNPLFKMSVAYMYHRRGEVDKAIQKYDQIIKIDDQFAEAYFNKADIYLRQNKIGEALKLYDQIAAFRPDFPNLHLVKGRILYTQGRIADAKKEFILEIKGNRENMQAYQILATVFFQERNYTEAQKLMAFVVSREPQNSQFRYYLAVCYVQLRQNGLAVAELQEILKYDPSNPQAKQLLTALGAK